MEHREVPHYLSRSRHGIWYSRVAVPAGLRAAFPKLPGEIKASTRSANRRVSARQARQIYLAWLHVQCLLERTMQLPITSNFTLVQTVEPDGRRRIELKTSPEDTREQIRVALEFMREQLISQPAGLAKPLDGRLAIDPPVGVADASTATAPGASRIAAAVVSASSLISVVSGISLVFLAILGGLAARVGGAPVTTGAVRVTFWGAFHDKQRYGIRLRRCIYTGAVMHSWTAFLGLRGRRRRHLSAARGHLNAQ